jgi:hypothetical protein
VDTLLEQPDSSPRLCDMARQTRVAIDLRGAS